MTLEELCRLNNHFAIDFQGAVNTRCPSCGDSQKVGHTRNYGQAYIYPDGFTKCFRCGEYLTAVEFIEKMFDTLNIPLDVDLLNQYKTKEIQYIYTKAKGKYTAMCEGEFNHYGNKIEYISKRLGKEIKYEDAVNYKFVFDIYKYNDIISERYKFIPNYDDYVAYVTHHDKKLILRAINDKAKLKHMKIDLIQDKNSSDFWAPANYSNDLLSKKKLILSEGIFTINNTFIENQFNCQNSIVASLSKLNLIKTIKYIYYENLTKFDLVLLRDKDVDKRFIYFLMNCSKKYINSLTVYSNVADNDFNSEKIYMQTDLYRKFK